MNARSLLFLSLLYCGFIYCGDTGELMQQVESRLNEMSQLRNKVDSLKLAVAQEQQGLVQDDTKPQEETAEAESESLWDRIKKKTSDFFEKISSWVTSKLEDHEKKIEKQVQFSLEHFGSKLMALDAILSEKERKLNEHLAALKQDQGEILRKKDADSEFGKMFSRLEQLDESVSNERSQVESLAQQQTQAALRDDVKKDLDEVREALESVKSSLEKSKEELLEKMDFVSYRSGRAVSKEEVDTKLGNIESKIEFLDDSMKKKQKSLGQDLMSAFDNKISTTEERLRAEIDRKFNELKGDVQKGSDSDVSSMIKKAVKKHMHVTQDDSRGDRDRRRRNKLRRLLEELDD